MTWSLFFITWIAAGVAARLIAGIADRDEVMLSEIIAGAVAGYIALVVVCIGLLDKYDVLGKFYRLSFNRAVLDFRRKEDRKSK